MKRIKPWLAVSGLVISIAASGLGLAGCKSKDSETDSTETRTSRTSATATESSESGVTDDTTGETGNMSDTNPQNGGKKTIKWTLSSFDGGGPRYDITFEDDSIATYETTKEYRDPDHESLKGAGFTYTYTFSGLKPGTTKMTVEETIHGGSELEDRSYYIVTVFDDLSIEIEVDEDAVDPDKMPVLSIGEHEFKVSMEKNASAQEYLNRPNTIFSLGTMEDKNGTVKSCWMTEKIYAEEIATVEVKPGDIIRYDKFEFAIVYKAHTLDCVVIGHIEGITEEELVSLLSDDTVKKEFYVPAQ